jgi:hypothetical protein
LSGIRQKSFTSAVASRLVHIMTTYPGDILIVRYPRRHALVLSADSALIHVCLLSNEVDLAMDSDIILEPAETGLPCRLMAETLLIGQVGFWQVVRKIGQISETMCDDYSRLHLGRTTRLAGPSTRIAKPMPRSGPTAV